MDLTEKNTPRWIVFLIDLGICFFSYMLATLLRFNFHIPASESYDFKYEIPLVLAVRALLFYFFRTYSGIVRYTSTRDAQRIFYTIVTGALSFVVIDQVTFQLWDTYIVPTSIIIIDCITSIFLLTASRLLVKIVYMELRNPSSLKTNVIIYGAGEAGVITKRTLDRDAGTKYKVLAFVDDEPAKSGRKLEGVSIYEAAKDLEPLLNDNKISHLIIAIQNLTPHRKQEIIELGLKYNIKVFNVPPVRSWINGELSFKQIKKIRIEDLLERDPIRLDVDTIKNEITGKKILITGAAGSIGSEIVRQVLPFNPSKIIMLDYAESPLYELELEIQDLSTVCDVEPVIGDIRNIERMRNVFSTFCPDYVFHAAAYKHVPMMENNPSESILTNVCGTKIIADLAVEYSVKKFVMISTDKAVNPTNIMGATKRIAEIYTQSLNKNSAKGHGTKFITTRFGNVLGSNGSVIPRFRKQIEEGKTITVTHPEITRYFMTISEACQLVLEAGAMGKGGEIFIFDMGKSVRIADLAKKMVKLSGLELGKDIQLVYTGLRPGEKLYEELLNDHENTIPTHHDKIMIAKVKEYDFPLISNEITDLINLFNKQDNEAIVRKMKQIVPEYISNNSVYERLDKEMIAGLRG
jgi:FlaA1/EpsC-like NDP-sugar epimerase